MDTPLVCIRLHSDVAHTCLAHALTTEVQEIMGLLLGYYEDCDRLAIISRCMVLSRKDKAKDRVEVGYENLALASSVADELSRIDSPKMANVIGWYHSHPHITVFPSHVDVKTQGSYQSLDNRFLGLIFSVFDKGHVEICGFQSRNLGSVEAPNWQRKEIQVEVVAPLYNSMTGWTRSKYMEHLINMQIVLLNEEKQEFSQSCGSVDFPVSTLERLRLSSVYQTSLVGLINSQLLPLQSSLESRIASLKNERDYLLKKVAAKSAQSEGEAAARISLRAESGTGEELDEHIAAFHGSLHALNITVPEWSGCIGALNIALSGFFITSLQPIVPRDHDSANLDLAHLSASKHIAIAASSSSHDSGRYFVDPLCTYSPWLLVASRGDCAEEFESKRSPFPSVPLPLLTVRPGRSPFSLLCTVLSPRKTSESPALASSTSSTHVAGLVSRPHRFVQGRHKVPAGGGADNVSIDLKIELVHNTAADGRVVALLREHLHAALRLHHWESCR